ncbi:Uncharacterised protein [Vibrio cholerae]|nr:Uncharacterised protein [Vibrio cholerae]
MMPCNSLPTECPSANKAEWVYVNLHYKISKIELPLF